MATPAGTPPILHDIAVAHDVTEAPPNARFTDMGGGTIAELMCNHVQFFYDPTTQLAHATFNGMSYLSIADTYRALNNVPDILQVDFADKFSQCYAASVGTPVLDPVTNADLTQVSVLGVMALLKIAYDVEVNLRETQRLAAIAAAEAMAAAAAGYAAAQQLLQMASDSPNANGTTTNFSVIPTALTVAFTDTSTAEAGITISAWQWIFGEGLAISNLQSAEHTYQGAGTYPVTLIVTDSTGVSVKLSKQVTVSA